MRQTVFIFVFLFLFFANISAQQSNKLFNDFFIEALQGNIASVLQQLDSISDKLLSLEQWDIKQEYLHRFRLNDEHFLYKTNDSVIIQLINLYHDYWRNALCKNSLLQNYDSMLADNVTSFLFTNDTALHNTSGKKIRDNFTDYLQHFLKTDGLYAAAGKTGVFYDLLLHAKETTVIYPITTPEEKINVKVVFMDSLISNGWEEYATFGKYFPGGWATKDALFCARETYDLQSEQFSISYLMHEGKHFADYKKFPRLEGADLEYRAKLTELSAADKTLYSIIEFFIQNAAYMRSSPHSFADFCVIRDLSRKIFNKEFENDIEQWKKISSAAIHTTSIALLRQNTLNLQRAGAKMVKQFIK